MRTRRLASAFASLFVAPMLVQLAGAQIQVAPNVVAPSSSWGSAGRVRSNHYFYTGGSPQLAFLPSIAKSGPAAFKAIPDGLTPAKILSAYGMSANLGSGAIAIVIPYHLPSALKDFNTFSTQYGLPTETSLSPYGGSNQKLQVVFATGGQPKSSVAWGALAALTMEWVHAVAPKAKIYLVEAASDALTNVYAAVNVAKAKAGVKQVILPWGSDEYAAETSDDAIFLQPGVTFFAPAGDFTTHLQYPATSPNVVGVGGTNLAISGATVTETAWDSSAAGLSLYQPRPVGQAPVAGIVGAKRGSPDISVVGDPLTSVAVYSDFAIGGWTVMGGSSLSTAIAGAITNARGSFSDSSSLEIRRINQYLGTRFFRDIVSGSAGTFTAAAGYDILSGAGSPYGPYEALINKTYAAGSVAIETGSLVSGTLASLTALDGNSYKVGSQPVSGTGQVSQITSDIPLDRPATQMVGINLQLSYSSATGATIQVFTYNFKTAAYVLAATLPASTTMTSRVIPISKWSTMFDASNALRVRLKATSPGAAPAPFTLSADQLNIAGCY